MFLLVANNYRVCVAFGGIFFIAKSCDSVPVLASGDFYYARYIAKKL
jgi:hypothetical protein